MADYTLRCSHPGCTFPAWVVFEGNSLCQEHYSRLLRSRRTEGN